MEFTGDAAAADSLAMPPMSAQGGTDYAALGRYLSGELDQWKLARQPYEQKLAGFYADFMRIPRDTDTKDTGSARSKKAKAIFVGSTRNKIRGARAKIKDSLFGSSSRLPFDIEPVNQRLTPLADAMETILSQQLRDGGFDRALAQGVNALAVYGTAIIGGPFVRDKDHTDVDLSADGMGVAERAVSYQEPYFELFHTMDVYPDPYAKDEKRGRGVFWVTRELPDEIREWAKGPNYVDVEPIIRKGEAIRKTEGSAQTDDLRSIRSHMLNDGRIEVARFFGRAPRSTVCACDPSIGAPDAQDGDVEIVAILVGGEAVMAMPQPWSRRPVYRAVYEEAEHEFWGTGIAENNEPHQKVINAAFRLFLEGKGMALLPPMSVDRWKFLPTEDFKLAPGKVLQFIPNLPPEEKQSALIVHTIPDVTDGWENVVNISERFSDDDTSISKYTMGNDSPHLNQTATGISMIMSASSLPLKEVLQNIDEQWIRPCVEALIEWDFKYLEVEIVRKLHGDEIAAKWAAIKQYGKANLFKWMPTGASNMMAREVLIQKLQAFLGMVANNPALAQMVDMPELLRQVWDAGDFGRESPVISEKDMLAMTQTPPGTNAPAANQPQGEL